MTLSGGWRGCGAHDIDGTRTTRARVEQREVRGAFCFPFLARARADSVGTGAPGCTDRPPPVGVSPPRTQTWRLELLLVLQLSPGGRPRVS